MKESWTHATPKNSFIKGLGKVSLVLGLTVFFVSTALYFEHHGFTEGYSASQNEQAGNVLNEINLSGGRGPFVYEDYAFKYQTISMYLAVFLGINLLLTANPIKQRLGVTITSTVIGGFSLILVLFQLRLLFRDKHSRLSESMAWPIDELLRNSVLYDWICLSVVSVLLVIQILLIFLIFRIGRDKPA